MEGPLRGMHLQVDMLEAANYDDCMFEGWAYYETNEVTVSILVRSNVYLTKLLRGDRAMYARVHNKFMRFNETSAPPYTVKIEDVEKYPHVSACAFKAIKLTAQSKQRRKYARE